MTYAIADDAHITDIAGSNISHRTFDDFLDELYRVFKLRYVRHGEDEVNNRTSSHGQNSVRCISKFFSRKVQQLHYFPLPLLALCIANSSDATEILMLSYLLANPNFHQDMFGQDKSGSKIEGVEYLASSIFFGMLIGGTILGFLSDFIGRKPALLIGLSTNAIAGTLSSVPFMTPSFVELTMLRFIAGVGIGATVPPLFSLASEWSPKEIRGGVVTVVASFWMVGSLFVSGVAWCLFQGFADDIDSHRNTTMWRIFAASCALPSAMGALMVYRYVPESPRFLIARGHYSQAARSCNQITCILKIPFSVAPIDIEIHNNYSKKNDVGTHHREMSHIQVVDEKELKPSTPAHDNHVINTQQLDFTQSMEIFIDTLRKLYSRQTLSKTTLLLQSLWFSLSFGTYGITTWINRLFVAVHLQNLYLNSFLFALANLPGNIICIKYSDKWGRKIMVKMFHSCTSSSHKQLTCDVVPFLIACYQLTRGCLQLSWFCDAGLLQWQPKRSTLSQDMQHCIVCMLLSNVFDYILEYNRHY